MRALLSIVAIAALAAAAPERSEPRCKSLGTACSDLYLAIECGTLDRCIPRWEKLTTPVGNDTELCATCKKMVQEARDNLLSNMTQTELREVLEGSCDDLIPIPPFNGICKKLMDTFQDELNDMLVSRMDPTQVCTVSGLCWKPDSSDIEQRASDIFLRKSSAKTCNTCKSSIGKIVGIAEIAEKSEVVRAFSTACHRAGYTKTKCDEFAHTYVAKFLHHIQTAPSEKTCQFFGRCDGASRPMTLGPADTMECEFCEAMIHKVVVQFNNTSMKQQVKTVLQNICKKSGSWAAECQQRIDDDFDKAYDELISMLDPVNVCTLAGICNSKQSLRTLPMAKLTPARPAAPGSTAMCTICRDVAQVVEKAVNANFTQNQLINALDLLCDVLPVVSKGNCFDFVNKNVPQLIQMFNDRFTVDHICSESFKFCPAAPVVKTVAQVSDAVCDECQQIANYIVAALKDDRTEQNIKNVLDRTCQMVPVDYGQCQQFINTNIEKLYQILREEVTADEICKTLRLCVSAVPIRLSTTKRVENCGLCSTVVNYLIEKLKGNSSDAAILDTLEKVCKVLPVDRKQCQNYIDVYGEYIISMIEQNFAADAICAAIGLCKTPEPVIRSPGTTCAECQEIAAVIVAALNDDRSEQSIKAALERSCKLCPDVDGCRKFIDANIDKLYQLLREELTVDSICKALGLCGVRALPVPVLAKPEIFCDECQKIAGVIVAALNDDRSEQNIKAVLEKTCELCPDVDGCQQFMDTNINKLYQILREEVTVDNICKALGLCGVRALPVAALAKPEILCDECQKVAGVIVAALNDDRSEENIKAVLEKTCELCPDVDGCQQFIDTHIDKLYQMLREKVTVDNICKTLRLCGIRALPAPAPVRPKTNVRNCGICSEIVNYLIGELKSNSTDAAILDALERVCKVLPFDKAECQNVVNVYGEYIISMIQQDVAADQICRTIGLCATPKPPPTPASNSCQLCQTIAGIVISELKDNKTDAAIIAALERSCAVLPTDQTQCKNIIDTYSSMIVSMIQNDLTPDEICGTLQLCSVPRPKGQNCDLCETIAHFIVDELKDNKTEAAILDVLERVCNVLPVDKVSCRNTIDTYGAMIISLIQQDASADEICSAIGLCSTRKIAPKVKSDFCNACKAITGFLIDELKDNQTDEAVISALERVCKVVPIDKVQCQNYIDVYGNMVIEMIKNNLSADEICSSIGFCTAGKIQFSDNQVCPLCEIVVHVVEAELQNNNTLREIEAALQKACSLMPNNDQQQCRNMVNVYTAYIIDMVESLATAEQICQTLGLCPTPPTPPKCEVCLFITNYVVSELSDNRTETEILKLLDRACDVIPNMDVPQCKQTINQFSDMIITLLLQSVPPRKICEEIKMCPPSTKSSAVLKLQKPMVDDEKCALCKWLVTWVDDKLQDNRTEAVIIDELDKACDLLSDAGKCKDMVNDYVDMIVKMLIQYADPETICEAIKKCPAKQFKKDEPPCRYCRYVIDELRSDVQNSEAELKKKLDGICRVIPVDPSSCQVFVEQYADKIINLILMGADPEKICEILGVCPNKIKATDTKCNFCKEVMQFVTNEVQDETTDDEIVALVAKACNYVPAINREDCQRMVEIEGLVIVRLIGESLDADSICEAIKYCPEKRNADKLTCTWCQYALHFIQEKLYDNSTQQAIREELEKMCSDLPKPEISGECKEFVDTYGPSLEVIIAQDLDPSVICPAIHACPARKAFDHRGRRRSSQKCHDCVSTLRSFRHNPSQICRGVAPQFASKCASASSMGLKMVNAFESDYKICKYAKSCSKLSGSFKCNRGGCQHVR